MPLLEMQGICKSFWGSPANDHVDFDVKPGEIHALLGENGAGKTTLMNILFGLYSADAGQIYWKGNPVCFASPQKALEAGIGMVHQHFTLVGTMTVQQNITLGMKTTGYPFVNSRAVAAEISGLSKKYGLEVQPEKQVDALSVGEQQRVEIIKALYRKAELLILDEPSAVLTPGETQEFFKILQKLKSEGHAIVLITHRLSEIMQASDRVTILREGKKVADLVTKDTNAEELTRYMIGRPMESGSQSGRPFSGSGKEVLALAGVSVKGHQKKGLEDLSLEVKEGEILGIAGVDGNGQKELAEVLVGIRQPSQGTITYQQADITGEGVAARFAKGIAYVSDDRHHDGLVLDMDLAENMMLRFFGKRPYCVGGIRQQKAIQKFAQTAVDTYHIKTAGPGKPVRLMSGGNQQKAVLARELGSRPQLLVVSQPTRGLDIAASGQVRRVLAQVCDSGGSVVLISADLDEILELSNRIAVLFRGRVMGIVENHPGLDVQTIGAMMGGQSLEEISGQGGAGT